MVSKNNIKFDNIKEPVHNIMITEKSFCNYCNYPYLNKRLMKCSKCDLKICYNCATFINKKPFCPACVLELVRNDSLLIITKRSIK